MLKRLFSGARRGWKLLTQSVRVFYDYPKFLVPLLVCWLLYSPTVLYLKLGLNIENYTPGQSFMILFGAIFLFAFLLTFSASVLLELIEQHEDGESMDLGRAIKDTATKNSYRLIPIVVAWTIVWFILLLIEALFSSNDSGDVEDRKLTAQNAAETLSGSGDMSWLSLISSGIKKCVRMIVFFNSPGGSLGRKECLASNKTRICSSQK